MPSGASKEKLAEYSAKTRFKTGKKQSEIARKGGIASGVAKRKKKTIREELERLLEKEIESRKGGKITTREAMSTAIIAQAIKGNIKAFIAIRDTLGEKVPEIMMMQNNGVKIEVLPVSIDKNRDK